MTRRAPTGSFVCLEGEEYYRIAGIDRMPPFFMSIPSDTDLWMFLSSAGGLTAGRVDPEGALFPYETMDRLHEAHAQTGPITLIRARRAGGPEQRWQPFHPEAEDPALERNLYKNLIGNRVVFEEIHRGLGLAFRYRWSACDALGHVRTATLENLGDDAVDITLLDGLRNLLPHGVALPLYQASSVLVDAYKRMDVDAATGLATCALTAHIVDRAEAAEALRANVAWCHGLPGARVHLAGEAVAAFRRGAPLAPEARLTGRRGNYFVTSSFRLETALRARWHLVVDAGLDHVKVTTLRRRLRAGGNMDLEIESALQGAGEQLRRLVASADGLQLTGDPMAGAHHFANVLYNAMRGGIFAANHDVTLGDLHRFLVQRHPGLAERHALWLAALPATLPAAELRAAAATTGDADLERLCHEYLPLYFGRRHGDPSRPWNRFAIRVRHANGERALDYQGNWRDIFQNWEALALSFPDFLPGMIARFVNASTVDGFNPYRVTRDGIDWEVVEPDNPWSYIGYWGDHQVIYLLKFLEALPRTAPGALESLLEKEIFAYARVPYRIRPYAEIARDPHHTIEYDTALAAVVEERVARLGADGKLVPDADGAVYHVNLVEKLLVPALAKLSNLVPDGGIWMNTQRPEWNDANNALVGNGVSVVTLAYLRRYLDFLARLLEQAGPATRLSREVAEWAGALHAAFAASADALAAPTLQDTERRRLLDALGGAFDAYRARVYAAGFSGRVETPVAPLRELCRVALAWVDHGLVANRRPDGLYHAYNILELTPDGRAARLSRLPEMLEGQVALLSSGLVTPAEAITLVEALFAGRLYRADQKSFLLYPEKELPAFLEKNRVPEGGLEAIPLLGALLAAGDGSLVARDADGVGRFAGDFRNAADVAAALDALAARPEWQAAATRDREAVLELFEEVFHHRSFTGRSSTMYGYEGLGCIYWHMVAKLLLAVQEIVLRAERDGEPAAVRDALARLYDRIRGGLGFAKSVGEYGAFPADPYSHTPPHAGAQQPGMTGQVKEEILTRFGELGVRVEAGVVSFRPTLLQRREFRAEPGACRCYDPAGEPRRVDVPAGGLAFTFCQVPVIYRLVTGEPGLRVTAADGATTPVAGLALTPELSRELLSRRGTLRLIEVDLPDSLPRAD